ncbi:hypothetical protein G5V59_26905 [Nocardioides sp. W3-2-3]|uniref:hypothetical protein n=1 Tax=Nocardioides convexus TaxID=2712224 RepID=UPI00241822F8|nr:hypothetical protein [Nocardioides convexus]NHA02023.1 hypothetical protein [Nocardioides convexus]
MIIRGQKWGKDPLIAMIDLFHAFGPCDFAGWDANGDPVGRPHPSPWVFIAALNDRQTDNTWLPLKAMVENSGTADLAGVEINLDMIRLPCGNPIEPLTTTAFRTSRRTFHRWLAHRERAHDRHHAERRHGRRAESALLRPHPDSIGARHARDVGRRDEHLGPDCEVARPAGLRVQALAGLRRREDLAEAGRPGRRRAGCARSCSTSTETPPRRPADTSPSARLMEDCRDTESAR